MKKYREILFIVFTSIILISISCAVNPVTGEKELMLFSEKAEISLGKKTDEQIRVQYGLYEDPNLSSYISRIGQKIVPYTHRPNLQYHFKVLDTPVVNAFAAPGGYIYLTRGILAMINSESELAVIIGHELGHVNARHSVKQMSKMILINLGMAVGSALNEDIAKISGLAGIGIQLLFLKYSRNNEYQADSLGVQYARKAMYFPGKMISFFNSLQKLGDMSGGQKLPGFLSTHPLTENRVKEVKQMIKPQDKNLDVKRNTYLRSINKIVFGSNPRQGYMKKNRFYHPEMRFTFKYPRNWNISNTPRQVMITDKQGNAVIVLQAEKTTMNLPDYLNKKSSQLNQARLISSNSLRINGLTSRNAIYNVQSESSKQIKVQLTGIRKNTIIYTFLSACSGEDFYYFKDYFTYTIKSFSPLYDKQFINVYPKRVYIETANGRNSLRDYLRKLNVPQKQWEYIALLNSMTLDNIPPKNSYFKLIK